MADFSNDAKRRIAKATRVVERWTRNDEGHRGRWLDSGWQSFWVQLQANLTPGGSANAYPVTWDSSNSSGVGDLEVDTSTTISVKDFATQNWGLQYEWLRVQPIGGDNGIVYEVVSHGSPWYEGTLAAQLNQGSSANATVTVRGNSVTVSVTDRFLKTGENIASSSRVGIVPDVRNARFTVTETACT